MLLINTKYEAMFVLENNYQHCDKFADLMSAYI